MRTYDKIIILINVAIDFFEEALQNLQISKFFSKKYLNIFNNAYFYYF